MGTRTPPPYTPRPASTTPAETPQPTSTPLPSVPTERAKLCSELNGSFEQGSIDNGLPDKPMRYKVYLPPCYTFDETRRYPVLYLLHGQNSTEEQWIRIGAATAADQLIAAGDVLPFIIVFPFDYSYKQPGEYNFEDIFIYSLVPKIDSLYRTEATPARRAIGGLSRGGAWALRLGTRYPDLFGAIGAHSSAIFFSDENPLKKRVLRIAPELFPAIWLDAGNSDSEYNLIVSFERYLSENNIPHEWHEYQGWHDEKYWSAHVKEYLSWYAQNWNEK